jgi:hypothetical protein
MAPEVCMHLLYGRIIIIVDCIIYGRSMENIRSWDAYSVD